MFRRLILSSLPRSIFLLSLGIGLIIAGCANDKDLTSAWSTDKLYEQAKEEMGNKSYDKAIGYYEKLEGRAAGTTLAQQAQLEKAFAQYKNSEPALAVSTSIKIYQREIKRQLSNRLNPSRKSLQGFPSQNMHPTQRFVCDLSSTHSQSLR